jgi:hypothetical protein
MSLNPPAGLEPLDGANNNRRIVFTDMVRFDVSDTGLPMPPQIVTNVF